MLMKQLEGTVQTTNFSTGQRVARIRQREVEWKRKKDGREVGAGTVRRWSEGISVAADSIPLAGLTEGMRAR